ncbi:unnamed protein product [Nezara viridula]|uniref:Uncharacterized protein n=1 Tax=Nezara viridula TaxID=85310 RepID=A0A9P0H6T2_NEZVI|nr:unnamed protein product [Nezara viridula]
MNVNDIEDLLGGTGRYRSRAYPLPLRILYNDNSNCRLLPHLFPYIVSFLVEELFGLGTALIITYDVLLQSRRCLRTDSPPPSPHYPRPRGWGSGGAPEHPGRGIGVPDPIGATFFTSIPPPPHLTLQKKINLTIPLG